MDKNTYALVGNWFFHPCPKGLTVFRYVAETGALEPVDTFFPEKDVGTVVPARQKGMAYLVLECGDLHGCVGGGGYLTTIRVDPATGTPSIVGEVKTLLPFPSYFCLDGSGRYGLVTHMGNAGHVTKVIRRPDGSYDNVVEYDDTAVVLFRIGKDGLPGEVLDVSIHQGNGKPGSHTVSRMHSVTCDPDGELFFICDKGLDYVYTYRIDKENNRLVRLAQFSVDTGTIPRYSVFSQTQPLIYANNERIHEVFTYRYDKTTGDVRLSARTPLFTDPKRDTEGLLVEASDIILSGDGKRVYVSVRGFDLVAVFDVASDGGLSLRQNAPAGGVNPRGLCLSPDGRFLFCMNMVGKTITRLPVGADGLLGEPVEAGVAPCPADMKIVTV
jgi:6-phosphogluconolactonase (cycloisomerase 2 family)